MPSILDHVVSGKHGGADDPMPSAPVPPPAAAGTKKRWKPAKVALAATVLLFVLILARRSMRRRSLHRGLAENGWVLYTKPGCSHCVTQVKALGGWYENTVVCKGGQKLSGCASAGPACDDPGIAGYPYWHNTKGKTPLVGVRRGWELEAMASKKA